MAINTAERRNSAMRFGIPGSRVLIPDGSIDKVDRSTGLNLYSGFDLDAAIPASTLNSADVDLIFDELVTDNLTFRQVLQFIPHMDGLMRKNKIDHLEITKLLKELKTLIIPLKGSIQDSDRNQLRGRGENAKN